MPELRRTIRIADVPDVLLRKTQAGDLYTADAIEERIRAACELFGIDQREPSSEQLLLYQLLIIVFPGFEEKMPSRGGRKLSDKSDHIHLGRTVQQIQEESGLSVPAIWRNRAHRKALVDTFPLLLSESTGVGAFKTLVSRSQGEAARRFHDAQLAQLLARRAMLSR